MKFYHITLFHTSTPVERSRLYHSGALQRVSHVGRPRVFLSGALQGVLGMIIYTQSSLFFLQLKRKMNTEQRLQIYRDCLDAIQTTRAQLRETTNLLQLEFHDMLIKRLHDLRRLKEEMRRQLGPRVEEPDELPGMVEIIDIPTDDELRRMQLQEVIDIE